MFDYQTASLYVCIYIVYNQWLILNCYAFNFLHDIFVTNWPLLSNCQNLGQPISTMDGIKYKIQNKKNTSTPGVITI